MHLVGCIIRIYHDERSPECQKKKDVLGYAEYTSQWSWHVSVSSCNNLLLSSTTPRGITYLCLFKRNYFNYKFYNQDFTVPINSFAVEELNDKVRFVSVR